MVRTGLVAIVAGTAVTCLSLVVSYTLSFRLRSRTAMILLGVVVASAVASLLVRILAWGSILAKNGIINETLERIGLITDPIDSLFFSPLAVGITMTYLYLPFGILIVHSSMHGINPSNIEASRDLGAGRWRTVANVVVPQARTGMAGAFALTAMLASADFVTPRLVGGPTGLMVGSLVQDLALTAGDTPGAAALAISFVVLFIVALGCIALILKVLLKGLKLLEMPFNSMASRVVRNKPAMIDRRSWSTPITMLVLVYLVVPTFLVVLFSFNESRTTGLPMTGLTTKWYPEIVGRAGFAESLRGSLMVASFAVVMATAIAVPFAFAMNRSRGAAARLLWLIVVLPVMIPGVVLGSALFAATEKTGIPLGLATTAVVHVVLLVSEITLIVYARLSGLDGRMIEAARDLGSSPSRALRTVTLPLLLPAIIGAALLAAAVSLDEVFVTTFTLGPDNTLPIWLFGQARRGLSPGINAVGAMLLFGTLLSFVLAITIGKRSVLDREA